MVTSVPPRGIWDLGKSRTPPIHFATTSRKSDLGQWDVFAADGGTDIHHTLQQSGEPPVPELAVAYGQALGHLPVPNVNDLWALNRRRYEYQAKYLAYWTSTADRTKSGDPVDAIIAPVAPTASYRRGEGMYPGYTGVFNVLDFSVAAVPVTTVDRVRDVRDGHYTPKDGLDATIWQQCEIPSSCVPDTYQD